MINKFTLLILCTLTFFLYACDTTSNNSDKDDVAEQKMYVLNEGAFMGDPDASVTEIDLTDMSTRQNVFQSQNNRPLGDILQSALVDDDRMYLVVNNSQKIEVVDPQTLTSIETIITPDGSSPRYIEEVNNELFVTDLYGQYVYVYNKDSYELTDSIQVGMNPDGIAEVDDYLFVANSGFGFENTISVIYAPSKEVTATIEVNDNPGTVREVNDMIWVMSVGRYDDWNTEANEQTPGALQMIDPFTQSVVKSFSFDGHPGDFVVDEDNKKVYVNFGGAVRMLDYSGTEIADEGVVIDNSSLYALYYEDEEDRLIASEVQSFDQRATVIFYNQGFSVDTTITAGIAPGDFVVIEEEED